MPVASNAGGKSYEICRMASRRRSDLAFVKLNRGRDERARAPRELPRRFYHDRVICAGSGRGKLQISRDLNEFVLQNCFSHAFNSPNTVIWRKSASTSAASARGHSTPCMVALSVRQSPSRNGGRQLCAHFLETRMLRSSLDMGQLIPHPRDQEILTPNWGGSGCPLLIRCSRSSRFRIQSIAKLLVSRLLPNHFETK